MSIGLSRSNPPGSSPTCAAGLLVLALSLAGCDAVTGLFGDQQKKVLESYESYRQAVDAGDLASLKKHLTKSRAKELDAPQAEAALSAIRTMRPKEARIVGTSVRSAAATLDLSAPADGGTARGTIELLKEGGRWKVDKESWKIEIKLAEVSKPAAPAPDEAEPVASGRPKPTPAEAVPPAPPSPPALTDAQQPPVQMSQRQRDEAARDAKGEAHLAFDDVNANWILKRGFGFETRLKNPKQAVVHFGPETVQNSYHGIVLKLDATRTGRHYADGAGINAEFFENKPYVIGELVPGGARASLVYYAHGGQNFPPKGACTIRLDSAYSGKPDSVLAGEVAECVVFSAGIEHRIAGLKFSMRGISLR